MKITVKLFAGLRQYLPKDAEREGLVLEVAELVTPNQVLERLHVPAENVHLVLVNGVFVVPEQRTRLKLNDRDVLSVWPAVAGG